jgi:Histone methylation protein DOT1
MGKFSRIAAYATAIPGSIQSNMFDRMFGVSISVDSVTADYGENNGYGGSHWLPVRRALRKLNPGPQDVFVDLGSGKGIVLLIAGRLPFGRVIGVDIDEELDKSAKENIALAADRFIAAEVTSIAASVLEWPVPDDLSVVYMFNPFTGKTFHEAMERLFDSYDRKPRELRIIYGYPAEHDWLVSSGRVVVEGVSGCFWPARPGWWRRGHVLVTYRVVRAAADEAAADEAAPDEAAAAAPGSPTRRSRALQRWSTPNGFRLVTKQTAEGTYYLSPTFEPGR